MSELVIPVGNKGDLLKLGCSVSHARTAAQLAAVRPKNDAPPTYRLAAPSTICPGHRVAMLITDGSSSGFRTASSTPPESSSLRRSPFRPTGITNSLTPHLPFPAPPGPPGPGIAELRDNGLRIHCERRGSQWFYRMEDPEKDQEAA